MDQELIAYSDEHVRELRAELAGLRTDVRYLAEVFLGVSLGLEHLRDEAKLQFKVLQDLLRPTQAQLDRRISKLENLERDERARPDGHHPRALRQKAGAMKNFL